MTRAERDWLDALWRQAERDADTHATPDERMAADAWAVYAYFKACRDELIRLTPKTPWSGT
jgi:hypothetical protein